MPEESRQFGVEGQRIRQRERKAALMDAPRWSIPAGRAKGRTRNTPLLSLLGARAQDGGRTSLGLRGRRTGGAWREPLNYSNLIIFLNPARRQGRGPWAVRARQGAARRAGGQFAMRPPARQRVAPPCTQFGMETARTRKQQRSARLAADAAATLCTICRWWTPLHRPGRTVVVWLRSGRAGGRVERCGALLTPLATPLATHNAQRARK